MVTPRIGGWIGSGGGPKNIQVALKQKSIMVAMVATYFREPPFVDLVLFGLFSFDVVVLYLFVLPCHSDPFVQQRLCKKRKKRLRGDSLGE